MLLKIDENLHADVATLLRSHGHNATTVFEQNLQGQADSHIADVCVREERIILTLDTDFSDIRHYPPERYSGIIVLRLNDQSRKSVLDVLARVLPTFDEESPIGKLWIIDKNQVRIRG